MQRVDHGLAAGPWVSRVYRKCSAAAAVASAAQALSGLPVRELDDGLVHCRSQNAGDLDEAF
jgi:hypothetical protein